MRARNLELVQLLENNEHIPSATLTQHFGVSDRSVRTYVRRANTDLAGIARIVNHINRGYALIVNDREALRAWKVGCGIGHRRALPQTNEERIAYLLDDLLSRTDWITSAELADILFISTRTISANLKEVERVLLRFELSLERRPHYGIRVIGPELKRRICLANVTMGIITGGGTGGDLMLDQIAGCVDEVLHAKSFEINSVAYQNLLVHIGVAIMRLRRGHRVPFDAERLARLRTNPEYSIASSIAADIDTTLGTKLPDEEIAYIAIHLMGKKILDETEGSDDGIAISDEVWDVVSQMLEAVSAAFHFDLRNDLELRMNLARHVVPLSVRLRYHMNLANPLLPDIRRRFPLAYSMALEAATVLVAAYNAAVSEDEIGYIALALALALERKKADPVKRSILVVCASGMGSARLLEHQYRKEFGPYLDTVVACDRAQLNRMDLSHIDYVFTTVPIERKLPVPVRQVGFFLDQDERKRVHELLTATKTRSASIEPFSPSLFFAHLAMDTKDGALLFLCEQIAAHEKVSSDFLDQVLQRETMAPTAFGNMVAMPHPLKPASVRTFVCAAVLETPIAWGNQQVQVVFLVSVAEDEDPPRDFYEDLAELFGDEQAIRELIEDQSFERLLHAIGNVRSESEGVSQ